MFLKWIFTVRIFIFLFLFLNPFTGGIENKNPENDGPMGMAAKLGLRKSGSISSPVSISPAIT